MKKIGIVLALIGLYFTIFGVTFLIDGFAVGRWPNVEGKIVNVKVRTYNVSKSRGVSSGDNKTYYPNISYSYEVNGMQFNSERYKLGETFDSFKTKPEARAAAKKFIVDEPITVFYDPDDPSSSVLNNTYSWPVFMPIVLGLLFIGTGFIVSKIKTTHTITNEADRA